MIETSAVISIVITERWADLREGVREKAQDAVKQWDVPGAGYSSGIVRLALDALTPMAWMDVRSAFEYDFPEKSFSRLCNQQQAELLAIYAEEFTKCLALEITTRERKKE